MRSYILLLFFFVSISFLSTGKTYSQENSYTLVADVMPQPIGGLENLYKNIVYPATAKKAGVSGKVYLMAYINENGDVDNVKIIKGLGMGCDEAAIKVVKSTKFKPAVNNGEVVKAKLSIPIKFELM